MTPHNELTHRQAERRPDERGAARVVFREINERLRDLADAFSSSSQTLQVVCECGSGDCIGRFPIAWREYERLRGRLSRFAVKPGHEQDGERVVERHHEYVVVAERAEAST